MNQNLDLMAGVGDLGRRVGVIVCENKRSSVRSRGVVSRTWKQRQLCARVRKRYTTYGRVLGSDDADVSGPGGAAVVEDGGVDGVGLRERGEEA